MTLSQHGEEGADARVRGSERGHPDTRLCADGLGTQRSWRAALARFNREHGVEPVTWRRKFLLPYDPGE